MYDYLADWIQRFYKSRKNRRKVFEKFGEKAFLLPSELKFPVINPRTGEYDCGLLLAAYVRARAWSKKFPKYREVAKMAKKLYKENNCSEKKKIELKEATELKLPPETYEKIKRFLTLLFVKENGARTKFAQKYNVKGYTDFYRIFKEIKQNLRSDREGLAFAIMTDIAKTYVGRTWRNMVGQNPTDKVFNSWVVALRNVALVLDNLNVLKKALQKMQKEYDERKR